MKRFILKLTLALIVCPIFLYSSAEAGNGSFLITKSTYLFANPYKKDDKILLRKRMAYEVVGVISLNRSLMFEILAAPGNRAISGEGYIAETDDDLRALSSRNVKEVNVYQELPQNAKDLAKSIKAPFEKLSFAGMTENSTGFPEITWRAVKYEAVIPIKYWVPEWAGIYRPDKDSEWMNRTYKKLIKSPYKKGTRNKMLMGLVEIGFTEEQVELTLGQPLKKTNGEEKPNAEKKDGKPDEKGEEVKQEPTVQGKHESHWIYKTQKIVFKDGRISRVL